jgi:hypothetical protein
VAAAAENDVWVLGDIIHRENPSDPTSPAVEPATLTWHWNGHYWRVVRTPVPTGEQPWIGEIVAAHGSSQLWAVGGVTYPADGHFTTLTERYTGGRWVVVPSPNCRGEFWNGLSGVVAIAPSDVWAVGLCTDPSGGGGALIEHFDGHHWQIIPAPTPGLGGAGLQGVTSVPRRGHPALWAVGAASPLEPAAPIRTLALLRR